MGLDTKGGFTVPNTASVVPDGAPARARFARLSNVVPGTLEINNSV
ncbi:MAG: hypothetical protein HN621_09465 [Porticoccaceae bacterium]|nr:hypothetical protein [Porticoccaceae bacterium]